MKLLVCVKEVPDIDIEMAIDASGNEVSYGPYATFRMNVFDEYAVEESVRIKEHIPGSILDVITVGPSRAAKVIERSIGMGADNGIHILTDSDPTKYDTNMDAIQVAAWITEYAKQQRYDLVLTGVMSEDMMQGQVGPMLAELLAVSCATSVMALHIEEDGKSITVEREIEGGLRDRVRIGLPALVTIQSGINQPRYPSLPNMLRARKKRPHTIDADALEKVPRKLKTDHLAYPEKLRDGTLLEGTITEKAETLYKILAEKALLISAS